SERARAQQGQGGSAQRRDLARGRARPLRVRRRKSAMNFELSEEQQQIRDTFARFCDERIIPHAAEIDEAHAFPRELFQEVAALGFFGMRYSSESGGLGLDLVTL